MSLADKISSLPPSFQKVLEDIIVQGVIPAVEENAIEVKKEEDNPTPGTPSPFNSHFLFTFAKSLKEEFQA
jgi:hypothetical protein